MQNNVDKVTLKVYHKPLKKRKRVKSWKKEGEYTYIGNVAVLHNEFINSDTLKYVFTDTTLHSPSLRERHQLKKNNPLLINAI